MKSDERAFVAFYLSAITALLVLLIAMAGLSLRMARA
jgi:hypothetical protein